MKDLFWIIIGIAAALLIIVGAVGAWLNRDEKGFKPIAWLIAGGAGLVGLLIAFFVRRKSTVKVIEVKPHKRTVAPTEKEKQELDQEKEGLEEKEKELQAEKEALDQQERELQDEVEKVEEEARKTDERLAEIDGSDSDDSGSRKPDPDVAEKLKG